MSDFKIVCGTNPRDNRILNLDKVCEITLDEEYLENSNCVRIYTERGENWNFETDLENIQEVMYCLNRPDSENNIEFCKSVWYLGNPKD